jgi:membrane associated rhomboid family serine protease
LRTAFTLALSVATLLWVVKLVEYLGGFDLGRFGIYPRVAEGLAGILFAPFIHASFAHLFANTAPIIVIGSLLLYAYPRAARVLLPTVYLVGGLAVWLFAREAYHIGASGIVFGMLFFVMTAGLLRRDRRAMAISLVMFFLYGSMIWGVLPQAREISFESHLAGAVPGILLAILLPHHDPAPPRRQYSWESNEDEDDEYDWPQGLRHRENDGQNNDSASPK